MVYPRFAEALIRKRLKQFPIVAITGPRQSGKTTLAKKIFFKKPYRTLEDPDQRSLAEEDPKAFLQQFPEGGIIDEVQRVPDLLSYLQGVVDGRQKKGEFILTGSQQFPLLSKITQSLAGRIFIQHLHPMEYLETKAFYLHKRSWEEVVYQGGFPSVQSQPEVVTPWMNSYITTCLEKDIRDLIRVKSLSDYQRFLQVMAGRSGQILNLSQVGSDLGISYHTVQEWLNVLEVSGLAYRLRPYYANITKRLTKSVKFYFLDTGLLCRLLGMTSSKQILTHPLKGAIFETWVVSEVLKGIHHRDLSIDLFYYHEQSGVEVDLLLKNGLYWKRIEIKSGQTVHPDFFLNLLKTDRIPDLGGGPSTVVYTGEENQDRSKAQVVSWRKLTEMMSFNSSDKIA